MIDKLRLVVEIPNTGKVTWDPQKDLYDLGEKVTLEAIPSNGHAFVGWEGYYKGTDNPFTIKMDIKMGKNITLKPKFAKLFRFVGVVAEGKGEVIISPKQEWYPKRTPADVEAIPADGYEFIKWTLRGYDLSTVNPLKGFKTYDVDMEIEAHFKYTKPEDTIGPVILVTGSTTVTHEAGTSYTDAGAGAEDAVDGIVTVATSGSVEEGIPGTYTLTYSAVDAAGNKTHAMRTVMVQDTIGPVILVTGSTTVTHEAGTSYTDAGAGAEDAVDGIVTVATSGSVEEGIPGTYTLTYSAVDAAGNKTHATRTVTVQSSIIEIVAMTRAPFAFSFGAKEGRVYDVQSSQDLRSWGTLKSYNGTGTLIRFEDERDQVFPQIYYRVRVAE